MRIYNQQTQQFFMLQKVDVAFTFCNICRGGNTRNKQSQLATQRCCATRCTKMLPILLWPAMQAYFLGLANATAAILDFKRRGRLGRVERATKGQGTSILQIQHGGYV